MSEKRERETEKLTYFCWVRVVDVLSPTTPAPVKKFKVESLLAHWDRPKRPIRAEAEKPGEPIGVWSVPDGHFGREAANTAFDFGPAFLDEAAATNWIASDPAGQRWDKESLNRFLLQFSLY